jgi:hypothetical protein
VRHCEEERCLIGKAMASSLIVGDEEKSDADFALQGF